MPSILGSEGHEFGGGLPQKAGNFGEDLPVYHQEPVAAAPVYQEPVASALASPAFTPPVYLSSQGQLRPGQEKTFPTRWGVPPLHRTADHVVWPDGYGEGSSAIGAWIEENLKRDAEQSSQPRSWTFQSPGPSRRRFRDGPPVSAAASASASAYSLPAQGAEFYHLPDFDAEELPESTYPVELNFWPIDRTLSAGELREMHTMSDQLSSHAMGKISRVVRGILRDEYRTVYVKHVGFVASYFHNWRHMVSLQFAGRCFDRQFQESHAGFQRALDQQSLHHEMAEKAQAVQHRAKQRGICEKVANQWARDDSAKLPALVWSAWRGLASVTAATGKQRGRMLENSRCFGRAVTRLAENSQSGLLATSWSAWQAQCFHMRSRRRALWQTVGLWSDRLYVGLKRSCLLSWCHLARLRSKCLLRSASSSRTILLAAAVRFWVEAVHLARLNMLDGESRKLDHLLTVERGIRQEQSQQHTQRVAKLRTSTRSSVEGLLKTWILGENQGCLGAVLRSWHLFVQRQAGANRHCQRAQLCVERWLAGASANTLHFCFLHWKREAEHQAQETSREAKLRSQQETWQQMLLDEREKYEDTMTMQRTMSEKRCLGSQRAVRVVLAKWQLGDEFGIEVTVMRGWAMVVSRGRQLARQRQAVHGAVLRAVEGDTMANRHFCFLNWMALTKKHRLKRHMREGVHENLRKTHQAEHLRWVFSRWRRLHQDQRQKAARLLSVGVRLQTLDRLGHLGVCYRSWANGLKQMKSARMHRSSRYESLSLWSEQKMLNDNNSLLHLVFSEMRRVTAQELYQLRMWEAYQRVTCLQEQVRLAEVQQAQVEEQLERELKSKEHLVHKLHVSYEKERHELKEGGRRSFPNSSSRGLLEGPPHGLFGDGVIDEADFRRTTAREQWDNTSCPPSHESSLGPLDFSHCTNDHTGSRLTGSSSRRGLHRGFADSNSIPTPPDKESFGHTFLGQNTGLRRLLTPTDMRGGAASHMEPVAYATEPTAYATEWARVPDPMVYTPEPRPFASDRGRITEPRVYSEPVAQTPAPPMPFSAAERPQPQRLTEPIAYTQEPVAYSQEPVANQEPMSFPTVERAPRLTEPLAYPTEPLAQDSGRSSQASGSVPAQAAAGSAEASHGQR